MVDDSEQEIDAEIIRDFNEINASMNKAMFKDSFFDRVKGRLQGAKITFYKAGIALAIISAAAGVSASEANAQTLKNKDAKTATEREINDLVKNIDTNTRALIEFTDALIKKGDNESLLHACKNIDVLINALEIIGDKDNKLTKEIQRLQRDVGKKAQVAQSKRNQKVKKMNVSYTMERTTGMIKGKPCTIITSRSNASTPGEKQYVENQIRDAIKGIFKDKVPKIFVDKRQSGKDYIVTAGAILE